MAKSFCITVHRPDKLRISMEIIFSCKFFCVTQQHTFIAKGTLVLASSQPFRVSSAKETTLVPEPSLVFVDPGNEEVSRVVWHACAVYLPFQQCVPAKPSFRFTKNNLELWENTKGFT